jgi:CHASE3 domain sensor protein
VRAVTIRGKLFAAIALTVLGPLVTIGVAFAAFNSLGDRFDESQHRANLERRALDLKFAVTDMNGWQTAYGYGDGRFRDRFVASADDTETLLARAKREITAPPERALVDTLEREFAAFMDLDADAWSALQDDRPEETKRILLGPELEHFEAMAKAAGELAAAEDRHVAEARTGFDDARDRARRELVAVAIGAAIVIVLLLITLQDVVRLALERREAG